VRGEIDYDAQAAIELEMLAPEGTTLTSCPSYPYSIDGEGQAKVIRVGKLLAAVIRDVEDGVAVPQISARFHVTMALVISEMCCLIAEDTGLRTVALSGGAFQNRLLFRLAVAALSRDGFAGQATIAHFMISDREGVEY